MLIYKILRADEWAQLAADGRTDGAPVDLADGFIHFSTADQVAETLARYFAGAAGLTICACDTDDLGDALKWERSRGGDLFPHLYRPLGLDEVRWHAPLALSGGIHVLPDAVR
ncbi:hypothetical protein OCGS_1166 [Oceaniovalibus guishaninsula JLT2003]|uniref:Dihydroorotate dehydrogenase n=1 Tax=Oceaniovalibus guishaninsula JLT2003 TaxID=1231392 RepID=K2HBD1_9RHOB|nr:DUF952 domain-containing protein [Oceaniovalibus guishaninsula]EKE44783.1 hypothetical protein OCGS_1166 [Oceaniovalibus guishaninsula JLT2003]